MLDKKGIIVCFLLMKIKISFSCLPPNKPTNEPTCRGVRCEKTCKTEDGKDCDFKAVYLLGDEKQRKATTCSSYDETNGEPKDPWCFTNAEKKETGACKSECPGVKPEIMETAERNTVKKCECGVRNRNANKRIVLGDEVAKLGEFPWQVGILKKASPSNVFSQACGGALVGEKHVVTAAHCLFKEDPKDKTKRIQAQPDEIHVLIGATNLVVDEKIISETERIFGDLSELRIHPEYERIKSKNDKNDIAVLVLAKPVDLHSYPNIKPVCLPLTSRINDFVEKDATVMGWGRTGKDEPQTSELEFATIKIKKPTKQQPKDGFFAQGEKLETSSDKVEGPCEGDSGGPVVVIQGEEGKPFFSLIGVVSHNTISCSDKEIPRKYSDVGYFLHEDGWLMTALMDGRTCGGAPIIPITGDDTPNKVFYESLFMFRQVQKPFPVQSNTDAKACQKHCNSNAKCQSWLSGSAKQCQLSAATKLASDGVTRGTKHFPVFP